MCVRIFETDRCRSECVRTPDDEDLLRRRRCVSNIPLVDYAVSLRLRSFENPQR